MAAHTTMLARVIVFFVGMGIKIGGPVKMGFAKVIGGHHAPRVHQVIDGARTKTGKPVLAHEDR